MLLHSGGAHLFISISTGSVPLLDVSVIKHVPAALLSSKSGMLSRCWFDAGPALNQHRGHASCWLSVVVPLRLCDTISCIHVLWDNVFSHGPALIQNMARSGRPVQIPVMYFIVRIGGYTV